LGKVKETDSQSGSKSWSEQTVSRPLLPPNELLDLKPGIIYIYCFGFNPLKSKVTMFYQCVKNGLVKVFKEPDEYVASKYFDEEATFYDIKRRNDIVLKQAKKNEIFDW
jgi:type IV secretory pathway TraG/TraD family ATPase VirD4